MSKNRYPKEVETALDLWVKLARSYSAIYKYATDNIRSLGITLPQLAVIEAIGHLGPLTVGAICDKMLVTGGNMTLVLDNLEKLNLVKRVPSKNDRRAIIVELTPKGQKVFDKSFKEHAFFIANLMSALSSKEQKELATLLKKLGLSISSRTDLS